jgi:hypothetical protein
MSAEDLEQVPHLLLRGEPLPRTGDLGGEAGIGPRQRLGALGDAEAGEERALRGQRGDLEARLAGCARKGAEVDVRGEIGFARMRQRIGVGVAADGLQGLAGLRRGVALVYREQCAAL